MATANFKNIVMKLGKDARAAAAVKSRGRGKGTAPSAERLTREEILQELKGYIRRNPNSAVARSNGHGTPRVMQSPTLASFTAEEIEEGLMELKKNRPQLFDSLYENFNAEDSIRRSGIIRALRNRFVSYIIVALMSAPFALDIFHGTVSRTTDYKFVLFGVGMLWLGFLRNISIQYKIGAGVGMLWLDVNPLTSSLLTKFGAFKYLIEVLGITVCFFVVEGISNLIATGSPMGANQQESTPFVKWVRAIAGITLISLVSYVLYANPLGLSFETLEFDSRNIFWKVRYYIADLLGR